MTANDRKKAAGRAWARAFALRAATVVTLLLLVLALLLLGDGIPWRLSLELRPSGAQGGAGGWRLDGGVLGMGLLVLVGGWLAMLLLLWVLRIVLAPVFLFGWFRRLRARRRRLNLDEALRGAASAVLEGEFALAESLAERAVKHGFQPEEVVVQVRASARGAKPGVARAAGRGGRAAKAKRTKRPRKAKGRKKAPHAVAVAAATGAAATGAAETGSAAKSAGEGAAAPSGEAAPAEGASTSSSGSPETLRRHGF